jgi:hypothetical protein
MRAAVGDRSMDARSAYYHSGILKRLSLICRISTWVLRRADVDFVEMVDITYYIALPFVWVGGDLLPGEAEECLDLTMAVERAESLSREKGNAGALAYSQTFDTDREIPGEALVLKRLGDIPTDLSMLI